MVFNMDTNLWAKCFTCDNHRAQVGEIFILSKCGDSTANSVACLQHNHIHAELLQLLGSGQARNA